MTKTEVQPRQGNSKFHRFPKQEKVQTMGQEEVREREERRRGVGRENSSTFNTNTESLSNLSAVPQRRSGRVREA